MKDMKNSLRPKKGTKKQDFCTENSEKRVPSSKLPSILMDKGRWLYGINMELSLPSCRMLQMFLSFFENDHFFSAFFEVEELDLQAKTS